MKEQEHQTEVIKEFSRFAHSYDSYNEIQKRVAQALVEDIITDRYKGILDIGCGSGSVYHNLKQLNKLVEQYIALDSSREMLALHPDHTNVKKICVDFDRKDAFHAITNTSDMLLVSASAIQWSKDLNKLFHTLSHLSKDAYFAIFTNNTFKTLHQCASLSSPIYSAEVLQQTIDKYYHASYELKTYQLQFDSTKEMFRYIKKSGVSGGEKQLGYKEMKALMLSYPLDYLEFEVLFVKAISLNKK